MKSNSTQTAMKIRNNRSVTVTDEQIQQWAFNIQSAIGGGFGPALPARQKVHVLGPVVDDDAHTALIPATPIQVATLAALLAQQSKGNVVPAQCVPDAINLVTFTAAVMASTNLRLSMTLGTVEHPPPLTLTDALRITGLKERALRRHVKRLCPEVCKHPDWKLVKSHAVLSSSLVHRIRQDVQQANKARSKKGWMGQKKSLDRGLGKYAAV